MKNFFINLTVATTAAIAVFLIGFSVGLVRASFIDTTPVLVGESGVSLMINDSEKITNYTNLNISAGETVLSVLTEVAATDRFALEVDNSSSLGAFIKQIGEKKNGQSDYYWQYLVNGDQPQVAADKYLLRGGETILWTFSKSAW